MATPMSMMDRWTNICLALVRRLLKRQKVNMMRNEPISDKEHVIPVTILTPRCLFTKVKFEGEEEFDSSIRKTS
jgi:hypothetical protein